MDVPGDAARLRDMSTADARLFAGRVREFLIEEVCATGGHLGPNLGVVELTIALHRVFDSPADTLLFDTGHQAYVHKILTGRAAAFTRLRQAGGLSGYPSRRESPHDHIENSHASTALAYADGIAKGRRLSGETGRAVVAVVGDGALTGGMAWEALNNIAAAPDRPVIIVLNDNGRSYAPTVGGLAEHLAALADGTATGNLFTDLGLAYLGPVDGHDIAACERALTDARDLARPVVVHCRTEKGRGYGPARADAAELMHAVGVIDPATGTAPPAAPTWTDVFAQELRALGGERADIVAVTAAMPGPTGTALFGARYPERFYDVGIAEQHAVTSAAGLAMAGAHPVVAVYSTFLGRAFDQVLMDVALHRLPVTFVLDRAGITGPDGASHHGMWDPALLACVPGLRLAAPRDATRLRELLREAVAVTDGPTALRFPKAPAGADVPAVARVGDLDVLHRGRRMPLDVLIVSHGALAHACLGAAAILEARGIGVTVVDPRWTLPVDAALVGLTARHRYAVTVTDATRAGGPGGALARACSDAAVRTPVRELGLPAAFVEHGARADLLAAAGLSPEAIAARVLSDLDTGIEPLRTSNGVPA